MLDDRPGWRRGCAESIRIDKYRKSLRVMDDGYFETFHRTRLNVHDDLTTARTRFGTIVIGPTFQMDCSTRQFDLRR